MDSGGGLVKCAPKGGGAECVVESGGGEEEVVWWSCEGCDMGILDAKCVDQGMVEHMVAEPFPSGW